jgi:hypothetical protein
LSEAEVSTAKEEALKLIDDLPEVATWEDILYHLYVKKKVKAGIDAADEQQVVPHEEVKAKLLRK